MPDAEILVPQGDTGADLGDGLGFHRLKKASVKRSMAADHTRKNMPATQRCGFRSVLMPRARARRAVSVRPSSLSPQNARCPLASLTSGASRAGEKPNGVCEIQSAPAAASGATAAASTPPLEPLLTALSCPALTVDFSAWLQCPVFEPLKDREYFQRFFVEACPMMTTPAATAEQETADLRARDAEAPVPAPAEVAL
jgi:hypothetical protein